MTMEPEQSQTNPIAPEPGPSVSSQKANGSSANDSVEAAMLSILERQHKAHIADGPPRVERRKDWLDRAIGLLVDHADEFVDAMCSDFGHRSKDQSMFTDIAGSIAALKHAKKHLASWVKDERRSVQFPLGLLGSRAYIRYQPLGTIGVISPWNFPVNLTFTPLAGIFAAGNRTMIKPSEYTPATSEAMARLIREVYDEDEVAVVTGGPEVGAAFSRLPFDHMLFTGATSVAKHVMRAASENLVPVTLELGGKSPVIVSETADVDVAGTRIMAGKLLNAGQICLAPDYTFVPEGKADAFVSAAQTATRKLYPTLKDNPDYTSVVNQRHYDRIMGYLEDARSKGAEVIEINPANEDLSQQEHHKIAPHLIVNPTDDMTIMQDEIFGPIMPVKTYSRVDEAIDYINDHPRPLGLYYFGDASSVEHDKVLSHTTSGGVTVNDVIMHVGQEDLPFGGVGPSGMGAYHGRDGFKTFSHAKAIYRQTSRELMDMIRPPYTEKFKDFVGKQVAR